MERLFSTLIGNSVIACAIALLALFALLFRRPALAHVLWLLVLVKLVTPPIVRVPVTMPWATAAPPPEMTEPAAASIINARHPEQLREPMRVAPATPSVAEPPGQSITAASVSESVAAHGVALLVVAWAIGTIFYLATLVLRTRRFAVLLRTSQPASASLLAQVRDVANRLELEAAPDVRVVEFASSPMVVGMGGARFLVLPAPLVKRLGTEQLRPVLAHELAHLRRRDHWVRWLEAAATAVLWWHPLLWLTRRGLHEAEEQCCDAWVVWALPECRRDYADALVATAGLLSESARAALPPGASGLGQFQQLRRRLVMIMHRSTRHGMSFTAKLLAGAVLLALPVLPALAEREAPPPDKKVEAPTAEQPKEEPKDEPKEEPKEDQAGDQAPRPQIDAEIAKARARMRQDSRRYSQQQLREAEELYQSANRDLGNPKAKEILAEMVKKYPKFNRTGCAILYLGQRSEGEEREKYLKQAVNDFSDCFYGNGVQVGAYARYLLGLYYRDNGDVEKGNALLKELIQKYPKSVTHKGDQLAKIAKEDMASPPPPK